MTDHVDVLHGVYHDSVSLMQVSQQARRAPGVREAQIGMGTELNIDLLAGAGFAIPAEAGPNDLLIAVRADSDEAVTAGIGVIDAALRELRDAGRSSTSSDSDVTPRTVDTALARAGDASRLCVISVPGAHATVETLAAIAQGRSVLLFSDNVTVEDEVILKDAAARHDVLVMGPDCGTTVVNGMALGFANTVRRGPVGMIAASGTGAQQVMCLLDIAGVGISHCLGLGGRDLTAAVGGRSASQALAALQSDPATETIIVVSKPADPQVVTDLETLADTGTTPVHWATLGRGLPDLTTAVEQVLTYRGTPVPQWPSWIIPNTATAPSLRGYFCGGTLADETLFLTEPALGAVRSNLTTDPERHMSATATPTGHTIIDFGDDEMTRGRPHPMIDPSSRLERITAAGTDPDCGVLLLDLILGHGAHPDPAADLAAAIRDARDAATTAGRTLPVVVSLIGTDADPQGLRACAEALHTAGASVFVSNAHATRHALALLTGGTR